MKKGLALSLAVCMLAPIAGLAATNGTSAASADAPAAISTSAWMPHNYVIGGYQIPTSMGYDANKGTVSFSGSLNAGIATTGFTYCKPIDLTDFTVEMTLNIPDIDKLTWLTFTFLDEYLVADSENPVPVNQPFNAMNSHGGYRNLIMSGGVFLFDTSHIADNIVGLSAVEKNVNFATGEETGDGWNDITGGNFVSVMKFDETLTEDVKLSMTSDGNGGIKFNINDGAWKTMDNSGEFTQTASCLNAGNNMAGLVDYFAQEDKNCYFGMVMMYKDEQHRPVTLTVNKVNGANACDGTEPDYLAAKTVESGNIKATIPNNAVGNFGVYARQIDGLRITSYDDTDGDWDVVSARAQKLGLEVYDYFSVVPMSGKTKVSLKNKMEVVYTLPTDYKDFKIYFLNEDGEAQEMGETQASISDGKATIFIDNDNVSQVIIYAKKGKAGGSKGCGSAVNMVPAAVFASALLAGAVIVVLKKKSERGE